VPGEAYQSRLWGRKKAASLSQQQREKMPIRRKIIKRDLLEGGSEQGEKRKRPSTFILRLERKEKRKGKIEPARRLW